MIPPSSTSLVFVFVFSFFFLAVYLYLPNHESERERERERNHEGNEMRLCLVSIEFLPYHTYIQVAITAHHASSGGRTSRQSHSVNNFATFPSLSDITHHLSHHLPYSLFCTQQVGRVASYPQPRISILSGATCRPYFPYGRIIHSPPSSNSLFHCERLLDACLVTWFRTSSAKSIWSW